MSSIASPRKTDVAFIAARVSDRLRNTLTSSRVATVIASFLFMMLLVSFRPFPIDGDPPSDGGDIVNQLGFGLLGITSLFGLACYVDRRVLAGLAGPGWMMAIALLFLSAAHAADPPAAIRAVTFTLIGMLTVAAVLVLPRDAESFSTALAFGGLAAILISYGGLVLVPDLARHTGDDHAGFWRGLYSHKNIAGPVMACLSFIGLYLWRRGWVWIGALMTVAALVFMANTGSKTTLGLVPLAVLMVMVPSIIGLRMAVPILFIIAFVLAGLGTLGIVFIPPLKELADQFFPGLTYTGRTTLWKFTGEMIATHPWIGFGYDSFWGPFVKSLDIPFDMEWDIGGISHAHNGYLELAVLMGIPTLLLCLIPFIISPLIDFARTPLRRENVLLSDLFMMILLFTMLNSFLEAFFFRRVDPVWLFFVLATVGLRLTARFPIRGKIAE